MSHMHWVTQQNKLELPNDEGVVVYIRRLQNPFLYSLL